MIRQPVVAGRFYPSNPRTLRSDLDRYTTPRAGDMRAKACLVPHAGYMYSGGVAGAVYGALDLPRLFVILAPNHFGNGAKLALHPATEWETPLGRARVDTELAARILTGVPGMEEDARAHEEHSLEVQLPFLQYLCPEFTFVPIAIGIGDYPTLVKLGESLAAVLTDEPRPAMIVASSDMNHYEDDRTTRGKDRIAIDTMLVLDTRALYDALKRERISMCGYGPAIAAMTAVRPSLARLVEYATSGDAEGERERVVGYAGMAFA